MIQNLKNDITQKFSEDWPDSSPHLRLCFEILDYLLSRRYQDVQHLTPHTLANLGNTRESDIVLIDVLRYLNGSRVNVLTTHYELIDDDDEAYVLDVDEVRSVLSEGKLAHPKTGEIVPSPEEKVFMFFSPSDQLKDLQVDEVT